MSNRRTHPNSRLSSRGSASHSTEDRGHARRRTKLSLDVDDAIGILSRMAEGCIRRLPGRGSGFVAAHTVSASGERSGVRRQAGSDSVLEYRWMLRRGTCRGSLIDQQLAPRKGCSRPGDRRLVGGLSAAEADPSRRRRALHGTYGTLAQRHHDAASARSRASEPSLVAWPNQKSWTRRHGSSRVGIALATAWSAYLVALLLFRGRGRRPRRG